MKKWKWVASALLTLTIAFFIIASFVYTPETDQNQQTPPPPQEKVEKKKESATDENKDASELPEDEVHANENEGSISEGLREVFTSVIESARDLFLRDDLQMVAIGDSLTQGVGDSTDNGGYVGILEKTFNSNEDSETVNIANFGKRGNRTDHLLARMKSDEITNSIRQADLVLITIGANDVMKVVKGNFTSLNYQDFVKAQQGYKQRLNQIFEYIEQVNPNAQIYLIGLYNPFDHYFNNIPELGQIISDYNRISKEVLDEYDQAEFIPIKDIFVNSEEELLWEEDHFHPNERGYKQIAKRVLEYIRDDIEE